MGKGKGGIRGEGMKAEDAKEKESELNRRSHNQPQCPCGIESEVKRAKTLVKMVMLKVMEIVPW